MKAKHAMRPAAALALGCAVASALAQGPSTGNSATAATGSAADVAPSASMTVTGDAALGARIASQGAPNVAACAGCHGAAGEGNAAASFPRIAGQSPSYLLRQLQAYAGGARQNPVMAPIAKAMNDAQQRAAAVHYASLVPSGSSPMASLGASSRTDASTSANAASPTIANGNRGAQLANLGDENLRVQACANCHGPGGIGQAPAYPYLAGQASGYLLSALAEWKSGARETDPSGQMPLIAQKLGDADVRALVAYYAGRPAPSAALERDVVAAWRPPQATNVVAGPRGATTGGTQGVGIEQGAPTSGGQQGPGGGGGGSGTGSQGSTSGGTLPQR